ncbi:alpha/beta fold hydrolase [Sediminicola luteus]|uniref:Alpha/beta hydrolase n=1 Tax=Sediminicola luteus TaxID=319238 RepID=A0A2A4G6B6_9FLAO|nr:alpha/beta fold hydrolase [Sediminicola luteus]PCE63285.1 alpha/beta hydrolase [Sediminicola luteus]
MQQSSSSLYANVLGTGQPLIILHGFLGMSDNWKTLGMKYAEAGFEVHLLDQRNHGRSFHSSDFDYQIMAEDLHNYIHTNHIDSACILGHSMGGKTAMQFACDYFNHTTKLIVADIAPRFYPPHHHEILNGLQAIDLTQVKSRKGADEALSDYIKEPGIRQFLLKNLYRTEDKTFGFRCNLPVLANRMEEIGENIGSTDVYYGPTLFLRGDRSEYIQETDRANIKRHFPEAMIETVPNAGHWLHAENPMVFFEKSLAFLKS